MLQAARTAPQREGVREQRARTPPSATADGSRRQKTGREGLEQEEEEDEKVVEEEGGSCEEEEEEEDEDLDDLDGMEIDSCFPSLQPFTGLPLAPGGGAMPTLLRQQQARRMGLAESGGEDGEEEEEEDEEEEEEEEDDDSADVENLNGEIVYQPDGSAYIVESLSQLIQSGGGTVPGLLPQNTLPGSGRTGEPAGNSSSVYPQIINTFHIASSFRKWFDPSDQGFPNTSTLAGLSPVLHSFRVFDVRHKSNKDYLNSDGSAKRSCVSKDVPNNVDFSKFDGLALYGKGKPILMCFLCKLSFGYARSFATHAVHDHRMTLCEDERRILGNKHASAIIQGIGKDKEPLISFLEPKNKSSPCPVRHPAPRLGAELLRDIQRLAPGRGGRERGRQRRRRGSRASGPAKDSSALPKQGGRVEGPAGTEGDNLERNEEGELGKELTRQADPSEGGAGADGGGRSSELPLSFNCQGPGVPVATLAAAGSAAAERGGEDDDDGPRPPSAPNNSSSPVTCSMAAGESANRDSATAPEPNESPAEGEDDSGALLHHHHLHHHHLHAHHHHHAHPSPHAHGHSHPHPGTPCDLAGVGECPQSLAGLVAGVASGVECPKCDTVLGSSRSLGGHMTMMHSRNSCKTLKCPKCNWHYKYQQTLEAHMKEKHPDSGGSCSFCRSGQSHPRLARGESYTCGYKPFRCEVCNYSTTTKGNLSIHMQSDKHLNNMQTLQNGGTIPSASDQPKSKPMWRCEVCDYETNVARNLRIHMTSEKHMHNMMLLQQNVTQMQHGRLGLSGLPSPSEAELYQYYLTQNMTLPPGLKMDPTSPDAQYLLGGFHLDPSMAAMGPALGLRIDSIRRVCCMLTEQGA
ncbi:hypothetical protein SKAU_G00311360 [Synaphobranchus kaupii]|uniref:C2H2-type domain-containing protein n=1 Tax=Synaphobranchus kaupii TaxID=118154 RepID=A0A9Q1ERV7_SYNKA|nr:hypothetical protein SKAU_G00311360 [Synaphobranchus kaupii]